MYILHLALISNLTQFNTSSTQNQKKTIAINTGHSPNFVIIWLPTTAMHWLKLKLDVKYIALSASMPSELNKSNHIYLPVSNNIQYTRCRVHDTNCDVSSGTLLISWMACFSLQLLLQCIASRCTVYWARAAHRIVLTTVAGMPRLPSSTV